MHMLHLTLSVSDFEKSARFYCEVFGFRQGEVLAHGADSDVNPLFAEMYQLPRAKAIGCGIWRPDMILRLQQWQEPLPERASEPRPVNRIGYDALCFICPDPKAVAARAVELGATILYDKTTTDGRNYVNIFLLDPDGNR